MNLMKDTEVEQQIFTVSEGYCEECTNEKALLLYGRIRKILLQGFQKTYRNKDSTVVFFSVVFYCK